MSSTTAVGLLEHNPVTSRDKIVIEVVETGWAPWYDLFSKYHYLLGARQMPFSTAFTGFDVESGDPVCFMGMSGIAVGRPTFRAARACRMVVAPEWQGAGVGMRFLNAMCQREWDGIGFIGAAVPTYFHTAHPALCAALRRDKHWTQVSQKIHGGEKSPVQGTNTHYAGHNRAVAGYRFHGDPL